jgi:hypothetical protein
MRFIKKIKRKYIDLFPKVLCKYHKHRLFLLEKMPKNSVCAEIGVYMGDFSYLILDIVKPKKLYLIDPWKFFDDEKYKDTLYGKNLAISQSKMDKRYEYVAKRFKKEIKSGQIEIIRDTSEEAMQKLEDISLDWVYIDGNHSFDFVSKDLELSYSKVKKNGYITGDDYEDFEWYKTDVIKAVDKFCIEKEIADNSFANGQFILRK